MQTPAVVEQQTRHGPRQQLSPERTTALVGGMSHPGWHEPPVAQTSDSSRAMGGSTGHSDPYDPSSSLTLRHQHGPRCQSRPLASARPLVVTGALDISSNSGCSRATYPDIALTTAQAWTMRYLLF